MKPHLWVVSALSRIVPRRFRADWKQEWEGELRHRESRLEQLERPNARARWDLLRRSLGAFRDALWLQPRRLEEDLFQDLRYGARMLLQHRSWTIVAVLSLALGIGANTALFSVADEVLLKTLPVKSPEELVLFRWSSGPRVMGSNFAPGISIDSTSGAVTGRAFSYLAFQRFREDTRTLSDVFAFTTMSRQLPTNDDPEPPLTQLVSGNYFAVLGVPAVAGRTLTMADDGDTAEPVAVISHRYWKRRFGKDPAAVGGTITIGTTAFTIVGVTPAGFSGTQGVGDSPDVSIPLGMGARSSDVGTKFTASMTTRPWVWTVMLMGRAKPGVPHDEIRAGLQGVFQAAATEGWHGSPRSRSAKQPPDTPRLDVQSGAKGLTDARRSLTGLVAIMSAVVGLLLLIVCTNLVNLLLARGTARRQEMAVRMAMGARRGRLVRQLLTESVLLAACGAALGGVFAFWSKDLFLAWLTRLSPAIAIEPQVNLRTLAFSAAVTIATGLIVGVAPALTATRVEINPVMTAGASMADRRRSFVSRSLVVAQVAMSMLLLVCAGLFVRTLVNLQTVDVGFNPGNLLVFKVFPRSAPAAARAAGPGLRAWQADLLQRTIDRIRAVPGVRSATGSAYPLLSGPLAMPFIFVPGRTRPEGEDAEVYDQQVWDGFFETLEMRLLQGRSLEARDRTDARVHVVVNEALVRKYFPGANPIGQRIGVTKDIDLRSMADADLMEIVGVARDAKYTTVRQEPPPTVFRPVRDPGPLVFEVRTASDPMGFVAAVREAVRQVDASLVITGMTTQLVAAELTFARERHFAMLSSVFGLLALVLACIGLYGLMSYSVANRTREIGIRIALGAKRWTICGFVLRETVLLVVVGTVVGLGAASAATRLIDGMLFGLSRNDGWTIALATGLMFVVAAIAGYLPARRASRVDPVMALRYER